MKSFMLPKLASVPEGLGAVRLHAVKRLGAGVDIGVLVEVLPGGKGLAAERTAELFEFHVEAGDMLVEVPVGGVTFGAEGKGTRMSFILHRDYLPSLLRLSPPKYGLKTSTPASGCNTHRKHR